MQTHKVPPLFLCPPRALPSRKSSLPPSIPVSIDFIRARALVERPNQPKMQHQALLVLSHTHTHTHTHTHSHTYRRETAKRSYTHSRTSQTRGMEKLVKSKGWRRRERKKERSTSHKIEKVVGRERERKSKER